MEKIKKTVKDSYDKAKSNLPITLNKDAKRTLSEQVIVSNNIPGYSVEELDFGSYVKDNFAVLFIDMRKYTERTEKIGPERTFTTMHAFVSGMLEVISHYNGIVVDIMGDGFMVLFGGKKSDIAKVIAVQNAGLCGRDMLRVVNEIINPLLKSENIWQIACGVGVTFGSVVVTKIGINKIVDVKAFGDCINKASKYANKSWNEVRVSKQVKDLWPSSEGGKLTFKGSESDGYILHG